MSVTIFKSRAKEFDPLCKSPMDVRNQRLLQTLGYKMCSPCLNPVFDSDCCVNCFTLEWPGLTYSDDSTYRNDLVLTNATIPPDPAVGSPFLQNYYQYFDPYVASRSWPLPKGCFTSGPPNFTICQSCYIDNNDTVIFSFEYTKPGTSPTNPGSNAFFGVPLPTGDQVTTPGGFVRAYYKGPANWTCEGGTFTRDDAHTGSGSFFGFTNPSYGGINVALPDTFEIVPSACVSPDNDIQIPGPGFPWTSSNWGFVTPNCGHTIWQWHAAFSAWFEVSSDCSGGYRGCHNDGNPPAVAGTVDGELASIGCDPF